MPLTRDEATEQLKELFRSPLWREVMRPALERKSQRDAAEVTAEPPTDPLDAFGKLAASAARREEWRLMASDPLGYFGPAGEV